MLKLAELIVHELGFALFMLQGPLSVFCARARWGPVHVICLQWGEGGLGLTLRGDSPVLVAGVVPGGCAAVRNTDVCVSNHDGYQEKATFRGLFDFHIE